MRKYMAVLVIAVLVAAAFFLPEVLSAWNDRQLLDSVSIQVQDQQREGFAESVQLTVAEKVMLLRSGGLTAMELSREMVEGVTVNISGGPADMEVYTFTIDEKMKQIRAASDEELEAGLAEFSELWDAQLKALQQQDSSAYGEELSRLWDARLEAARQEVLNLQALGGLPTLWDSDSELSCTGYGELLYVDPDTRMNFQVYQATLSTNACSLELMVDDQSGRILSFSLQWGRDSSPGWDTQGAANFGGVWRNYWGMDSVGSGWYDNYTKSILEQSEAVYLAEGDYNLHGQISFTYDGQSFAIPLESMGIGGRSYAIRWNR